MVNETSFYRFSALTGYNKNQNLDIVVVLRAPLKYYKKKLMHVYYSTLLQIYTYLTLTCTLHRNGNQSPSSIC